MVAPESGAPMPTQVIVHKLSRILELGFADGSAFRLPFELLRVYSPSAEVRGHGPGQEVLQVGKRDVGIDTIEPVGHYGLQPRFTDGHDTGIFGWDYLHWLGTNQSRLWQEYLDRLKAAGASRDPAPSPASNGSGMSNAGAATASGKAAPGLQATAVTRPRH